MMVLPPLAKVFSSDIHWKQEELSRPEVGSSKNIIGGLLTSSRAIERRFFCPPERFEVIVL